MDRKFAEPLCIPLLAGIAEVSEAHFIRTFRATFGETPHRYLQRRRVERAMFLLRATDYSVTDICFDVGFNSLGTFSRTFRDIVGDSPAAFRQTGRVPSVPTCFMMAWMRPSSFGEAHPRSRRAKMTSLPSIQTLIQGVIYMLNAINISHVFVADQDQALDFYVGKLGLEVSNDQDLGFMRWLTVRVPGQPGRDILLEKPGPPAMDEAPPGKSASSSRRAHPASRSGSRQRTAGELMRRCSARASSSPRNPSSSRTASIVACAIRSEITSASCSSKTSEAALQTSGTGALPRTTDIGL